jgi:hypothetical protein
VLVLDLTLLRCVLLVQDESCFKSLTLNLTIQTCSKVLVVFQAPSSAGIRTRVCGSGTSVSLEPACLG